jgi:pimeloyl-[acyl-carrier protein] synthase
VSRIADEKLEERVVEYFNDPAARNDPYPLYKQVRELTPVYYSPTLDFWLVSSFAGIREVFRKDQSNNPVNYRQFPASSSLNETRKLFYDTFFLFMDPPDHTKYRNLFQRSFGSNRAEALRISMGKWFLDILSKYKNESAFEFIHSVAHPSPFKVMAEMLGIRFEDYARIQGWVAGFIELTEFNVRPEAEALGEKCFKEFREYIAPFVDERLSGRVEKPDILQDMVDALAAKIINADQLVMMVYMFIIAGHETTGSAIGNGAWCLLQHKEQWDMLVADPSLAAKAVDEILRYEGPGRQPHYKSMMEDVEILGTTIPKGERVIPWFGAAHRDPERYKDPDRFDITRPDGGTMVFGLGRHFCLGAAIARTEMQEFFSTFPRQFPNTEQVGKALWDPGLQIRGLKQLPVRLNG